MSDMASRHLLPQQEKGRSIAARKLQCAPSPACGRGWGKGDSPTSESTTLYRSSAVKRWIFLQAFSSTSVDVA